MIKPKLKEGLECTTVIRCGATHRRRALALESAVVARSHIPRDSSEPLFVTTIPLTDMVPFYFLAFSPRPSSLSTSQSDWLAICQYASLRQKKSSPTCTIRTTKRKDLGCYSSTICFSKFALRDILLYTVPSVGSTPLTEASYKTFRGQQTCKASTRSFPPPAPGVSLFGIVISVCLKAYRLSRPTKRVFTLPPPAASPPSPLSVM